MNADEVLEDSADAGETAKAPMKEGSSYWNVSKFTK